MWIFVWGSACFSVTDRHFHRLVFGGSPGDGRSSCHVRRPARPPQAPDIDYVVYFARGNGTGYVSEEPLGKLDICADGPGGDWFEGVKLINIWTDDRAVLAVQLTCSRNGRQLGSWSQIML